MPRKYELWKESGEGAYSFFPADNESARKLLSSAAELIWTVEADSWEEAQRKKNSYLGLEPYSPMPSL